MWEAGTWYSCMMYVPAADVKSRTNPLLMCWETNKIASNFHPKETRRSNNHKFVSLRGCEAYPNIPISLNFVDEVEARVDTSSRSSKMGVVSPARSRWPMNPAPSRSLATKTVKRPTQECDCDRRMSCLNGAGRLGAPQLL